jgi:uncharacterized damage-inducible protein DinB
MEPTKWFDRKFDFNFTENIFPEILKRLQATPGKLQQWIRQIPVEFLDIRIDNTWSIKENIGHLTDLEPLWQKRFSDIRTGAEFMTTTDLSNLKTELAGHNLISAPEMLHAFSKVRSQTLAMLNNINEELIFRSALHPRLKTPMRTMDLFLFVAEHDDHHLARMDAIAKEIAK